MLRRSELGLLIVARGAGKRSAKGPGTIVVSLVDEAETNRAKEVIAARAVITAPIVVKNPMAGTGSMKIIDPGTGPCLLGLEGGTAETESRIVSAAAVPTVHPVMAMTPGHMGKKLQRRRTSSSYSYKRLIPISSIGYGGRLLRGACGQT